MLFNMRYSQVKFFVVRGQAGNKLTARISLEQNKRRKGRIQYHQAYK